ncbi:shikimate kinase [Sediminicurvatus halobius]|uniref:Shikimate kinase n=1 Tax=Sediminicurvatus halobius TaxID=2182432 RepID=A0A2U2MXF9_9GAMM|nr:shikimate kinase [Spiribacter halobius]PWG61557.1 shikimate kinase [Spiribacter halobius]UEX77126.1 shikimate kinase [Spiribacter halobius]
MSRSNVVLIGMPGAGKSTVGVLLAKRLALGFVDTDLLIQSHAGRSLQTIVDQQGHEALRAVEEEVLQTLTVRDHVIATGGSAVYSEAAMAALRRDGVIVHLHVDWPVLERRVTNLDTRGIAKAGDQTLRDVYDEREPLYQRHAEITVDASQLDQEATMEAIVEALQGRGQAHHT